jgi:hypothetical protein
MERQVSQCVMPLDEADSLNPLSLGPLSLDHPHALLCQTASGDYQARLGRSPTLYREEQERRELGAVVPYNNFSIPSCVNIGSALPSSRRVNLLSSAIPLFCRNLRKASFLDGNAHRLPRCILSSVVLAYPSRFRSS